MDIYFDTCALNRLTDDLSQPRVRAESDAVLHTLELVSGSDIRWLTSDFLQLEVLRNPDPIKRAETLPLLTLASGQITSTPEMFSLASSVQAEGFDALDALHLAACEIAAIDFLLTVDDRFIRRASRRSRTYVTEVLNPIDWIPRRGAWQPKLQPPR